MKTMTCKQLGGPCDLQLHGENANDVIKAQDQHLKDMVAAWRRGARERTERHEGPVEEPDRRHGVVPQGQARLRGSSRSLMVARSRTRVADSHDLIRVTARG